jgi:RNA polymerase sigma-70 factor (ECF subfamily)
MIRDPHLAEDLLQDTWVVVTRKMHDFDETRDFDAWVRGIARNLTRNAMKKNKRMTYMPSEELLEAIDSVHEHVAPVQAAELVKSLDYLDECLQRVAPTHRGILDLCYRQGMSIQEIADQMQRTAVSVQVALSRIRQLVRRCIEEKRENTSHVV